MPDSLSILCLEPWLGGSHERFLEDWRARSRHHVEVQGLAPRQWKWRMRSAAWELGRRVSGAARPDVVLATDYLDVAALRGFAPLLLGIPLVLYFHENQLTYPSAPDEDPRERDFGYGFQNILSCLAADAVVFNSEYHRTSFGEAAERLLARLPKPNPRAELRAVLQRASVIHPGIDLNAVPLGPGAPPDAPLRVLFNHRWEHDKGPEVFLRAMLAARERGAALQYVLLGQRFADAPEGVLAGLAEIAPDVLVEDCTARHEYLRWLGTCDVVVSTARHEFFGMSVLEATSAGCTPLVPRRLAYPEVLAAPVFENFLYMEESELVDRVVAAAATPARSRDSGHRAALRQAVTEFDASRTASDLDQLCIQLAGLT